MKKRIFLFVCMLTMLGMGRVAANPVTNVDNVPTTNLSGQLLAVGIDFGDYALRVDLSEIPEMSEDALVSVINEALEALPAPAVEAQCTATVSIAATIDVPAGKISVKVKVELKSEVSAPCSKIVEAAKAAAIELAQKALSFM
jgi:hypothetical protein